MVAVKEKPLTSENELRPDTPKGQTQEPEEDKRSHSDIIRDLAPIDLRLGKKELPLLFERDFRSMLWTPDKGDPHHSHAIYWGGSWLMVTNGARGDGKSLTLAALSAHAMITGCKVLSNMPIAFHCKMMDGTTKTFETKPLEMEQLLSLSEEMNSVVAVIDEVEDWLSNQQWQSNRNRLLRAVINQMRKRKMDFLASCKDARDLDLRVKKNELDVVMQCRDEHVFDNTIPQGYHFEVKLYAASTKWTGKRNYDLWSSSGIPARSDLTLQLTNAKRFWHIYNSYQVQDFWESANKYEIQRETTKVGRNGYVREPEVPSITMDELKNKVIYIFDKYKDRVPIATFWSAIGVDRYDRQTRAVVQGLMDDLGIIANTKNYVRDYEAGK